MKTQTINDLVLNAKLPKAKTTHKKADKDKTYAVPGEVMNKQVEFLNSTPPDLSTVKEGDRYYWHLHLKDDGGQFTLVVPKNNSSLNLEEFACEF